MVRPVLFLQEQGLSFQQKHPIPTKAVGEILFDMSYTTSHWWYYC